MDHRRKEQVELSLAEEEDSRSDDVPSVFHYRYALVERCNPLIPCSMYHVPPVPPIIYDYYRRG